MCLCRIIFLIEKISLSQALLQVPRRRRNLDSLPQIVDRSRQITFSEIELGQSGERERVTWIELERSTPVAFGLRPIIGLGVVQSPGIGYVGIGRSAFRSPLQMLLGISRLAGTKRLESFVQFFLGDGIESRGFRLARATSSD